MKIKEFIKILNEYNQELDVVVQGMLSSAGGHIDYGQRFLNIEDLTIEELYINNDYGIKNRFVINI